MFAYTVNKDMVTIFFSGCENSCDGIVIDFLVKNGSIPVAIQYNPNIYFKSGKRYVLYPQNLQMTSNSQFNHKPTPNINLLAFLLYKKNNKTIQPKLFCL